MSYTEYQEFRAPDTIINKLEEAAASGKAMTLTEAGFFEWLNKLSKEDGWRVVWQTFNFPIMVLERTLPR
jgi:hypothetical protein